MERALPSRRLTVTDLACRRGERDIFSRVSLQAGPGEAVLLRGPNGAGKSTLLLALCGFLHPVAGTIAWEGADPEHGIGVDLHFVGHLSAVKPNLTVEENLGFWADINGGDRDEVGPALEAAGIGGLGSYEAAILSAGQTRRLALARLLVAPRPVWLLDEPTSALDAQGDAWVAALIDAHLEQGGMVIAATHLDLRIAEAGRIRTCRMGETT